MFGGIFKRIFGTSHERTMRKLRPIVDRINGLEAEMTPLSDEALRAQTAKFKEMLENGATLDDILPEAFATVREASRRVLNMRHYDVQLLGGIVLHQGKISEMKTGEGKTLVATCPMYLNALPGKGAHLVTVNDYLASRDADWMGQVYKFLGLSVGKILSDLDNETRRAAYNADITYGTNNEFGFDYLRDNMKYQLSDYVQRGHFFAIVDEVDSILIDEARTPLIISGQLEQDLNLYREINKLVPFLKRDEDYAVDEKAHGVSLNETGISKLEKHLKIDNIYDPKYIEYLHHVNKALEAHTLYKLDQNYVVEDGKIVIIDDFTGRMMHGRRWSDGLHQAIEAKEGVEILPESQTLATITFQNYFRMYEKLAGMTGTADTEAEEFKKIYKLDVVSIPTAKKPIRKDYQDVVYYNEKSKIAAIAKQIQECHEKGQPILIGTVSVEKSEVFSKAIAKLGIEHNVLNAKNHKREAEIIAQAGRKGAVTIATNMAGRGTDILLGGNPEFLARQQCNGDENDPNYAKYLAEFKEQCAKEKVEVQEAGGLFILGTERHESRRIDNQLRGRAGRQGDPGASRFYLSFDDDLLRIFGGEDMKKRMSMLGFEENPDMPVESSIVSRSIEIAQKRVEGKNFDIRKNLIEYDDVMNEQRKAIYGLRAQILKGEAIEEKVLDDFEAIIFEFADEAMPSGSAYEDWNMPQMLKSLEGIIGEPLHVSFDAVGRGDREGRLKLIWDEIEKIYNRQVKKFDDLVHEFEVHMGDDSPYKGQCGKDLLMELAQNYYLREIDRFWRAHLTQMTSLREAISLRGYAQKDPKQEYKREAYSMFTKMMHNIRSRVMTQLCKLVIEKPDFSRMKAPKRDDVSRAQSINQTSAAAPMSHESQVEDLKQLAAESSKPRQPQKKAVSMADLMPASIAAAANKAKETPKKTMSMADLLPVSMRQEMDKAMQQQRQFEERMRQQAILAAQEEARRQAEELARKAREESKIEEEDATTVAVEEVVEEPAKAAEVVEPAQASEVVEEAASEVAEEPAQEAEVVEEPAQEAEAVEEPAQEAEVVEEPAKEAEAVEPAKEASEKVEETKDVLSDLLNGVLLTPTKEEAPTADSNAPMFDLSAALDDLLKPSDGGDSASEGKKDETDPFDLFSQLLEKKDK